MNQKGEKNFMFGKHHSEKTKKLLSEMRMGEKNPNWRGGSVRKKSEQGKTKNQFGERNPFYGKHHTEASIQKMRLAKLGKHATEETKNKFSLMRTGEKNVMYGRHHSEAARKKLREFHLGRTHTEETKRKMGLSHKGSHRSDETKEKMSLKSKKNWQNREFVKKVLSCRQQNGKELYLDFLLQNYFPDEWKYVGDGEVIIGGLCPDFINVNGKKKIIEVFGDYWHNRKNMKYHQTEQGREEAFAKYGYSTLIIWEHELTDETKVIEKIKREASISS